MNARTRRFVRDVRALGALAEVLAPKPPPRRRDGWVEVGPGVFKRNPAPPAPMPSELAGVVNGVRRMNQALDQVEAFRRAADELERKARARNARHG